MVEFIFIILDKLYQIKENNEPHWNEYENQKNGTEKLGPLEISRWYLASCARHARLIVSIFLEKINRSFRRPPFAFHTDFHALLSPSGKSSLRKTSGKMDHFSNNHYFNLNPVKINFSLKHSGEIERIISQKLQTG